MSSNNVYLITGASRGIGRALVETYLAQPNKTVVAAVRNPGAESSQSLTSLPKGESSTLILISLDSTDETAPAKAVSVLKSEHGIIHLDLVVANAGISDDYSPVATVPLLVLKEHIATNAYGPLLLFQACLPLLNASKAPKFAVIGSPLGSIGGMELRPFPLAAYGASKALVNFLVRKMHFENEGIVALVIDPGFVQTDMGNTGARKFGMEKAYLTTEESVKGIVKQIDEATKEKGSGKFLVWNGEEFPW